MSTESTEEIKDTPTPVETPEVVQDTPAEPTVEDKKPAEPETPQEETVDKADEADETPPVEGYTEYANPTLKQVVGILKDAKVPVEVSNAIFAPALETGDMSKVDKKALVEALGADKAELVLVLAESYYKTEFENIKNITNSAYELVGGKEVYDAMREWVQIKETSDPDFAKDMVEIRNLIDTGTPRAVKAAVSELFDLYKKDPNTTVAASLIKGEKPDSTLGLEPLTRAEYTKLVTQANRNGTYEQVKDNLWARRQVGMKQGL